MVYLCDELEKLVDRQCVARNEPRRSATFIFQVPAGRLTEQLASQCSESELTGQAVVAKEAKIGEQPLPEVALTVAGKVAFAAFPQPGETVVGRLQARSQVAFPTP